MSNTDIKCSKVKKSYSFILAVMVRKVKSGQTGWFSQKNKSLSLTLQLNNHTKPYCGFNYGV